MNEQIPTQEPSWLQRIGIFWAWAGGFTAGSTVLVALILLVADLFDADVLFTRTNFSNGLFWASAILLAVGLVAPGGPDLSMEQETESSDSDDDTEQDNDKKTTSWFQKRMQKRALQVYNPWKWRFWAASLVVFALSVAVGF